MIFTTYSDLGIKQYTFIGLSTGGAILAAGALGAAGGIGGSLISASANGGKPGIEDNYVQGPNYGTSQGVENTWADFLNSANAGNNYNAISPDWNDIWNQTQQQVQNYFGGTATSPGVNQGIQESFAQRGMGGDPAEAFTLASSNADQAQELGNLSAQQNIAKQEFAQQGQQNWLNSLNQFESAPGNVTSEGSWTGAVPYATPAQQIGNAVTAAGTGVVGLAANQQSSNNQLAYLQSILNPQGTGSYSNSILPDTSNLSIGPEGNALGF